MLSAFPFYEWRTCCADRLNDVWMWLPLAERDPSRRWTYLKQYEGFTFLLSKAQRPLTAHLSRLSTPVLSWYTLLSARVTSDTSGWHQDSYCLVLLWKQGYAGKYFPVPWGGGNSVFWVFSDSVVGVNIQILAQTMWFYFTEYGVWERSTVSCQLKFTLHLSLYDNFKGLVTICLSI